jgi:hypothetical protein
MVLKFVKGKDLSMHDILSRLGEPCHCSIHIAILFIPPLIPAGIHGIPRIPAGIPGILAGIPGIRRNEPEFRNSGGFWGDSGAEFALNWLLKM